MFEIMLTINMIRIEIAMICRETSNSKYKIENKAIKNDLLNRKRTLIIIKYACISRFSKD
jgi:hypothetical protein